MDTPKDPHVARVNNAEPILDGDGREFPGDFSALAKDIEAPPESKPEPKPANAMSNYDTDPTSYPEGGLRAWSVVFGAWAGLVACFGLMNSIGAFQAYVSSGPLKHYSEGDVGWIFSVYVFLAFFCGLLFGPVFDTHGPRWLILLGSVLLVAAVMLLSISKGTCRA